MENNMVNDIVPNLSSLWSVRSKVQPFGSYWQSQWEIMITLILGAFLIEATSMLNYEYR